jgi:4-amino-4-deoxy-L-arabinose transferase-like glycosyltransferase
VLGVGSFATPDAPSTLFWLASTAAALRATAGQGNRWWLLAGLAAGLGIMSKFTNLFLGVGYVGWLLATRTGRTSLRGPGPYIALLAAALPVLPLILWNMGHDNLG